MIVHELVEDTFKHYTRRWQHSSTLILGILQFYYPFSSRSSFSVIKPLVFEFHLFQDRPSDHLLLVLSFFACIMQIFSMRLIEVIYIATLPPPSTF